MQHRPSHCRAPAHALALAFVVALAPAAWGASPGDAQTAEALYQSAKEALGRGEVAVACARFAESQRLDPAVGTLLNLADCEERSGKIATALGHFQEARDELAPTDYRLAFSQDRIAKLLPRVPHLVLRVRGAVPASMTVLRDETALGEASMGVALPVDPGTHVCVVSAPGHVDSRALVTLHEGETQTVDLDVGAARQAAARVDAVPVPVDAPRGGAQRTLGVVAGGAGLAALGVGTAFGILAKVTYDNAVSHCPSGSTSCDAQGPTGSRTAYSQATISDVAFIAGGALVAGGLVIYLSSPRGGVAVAPVAGPHEAGLGLRGAW